MNEIIMIVLAISTLIQRFPKHNHEHTHVLTTLADFFLNVCFGYSILFMFMEYNISCQVSLFK